MRKRDCVCACMCAPVLGVVREMSLLLRVTDINLWESCTLQHTHTEGKRESGGRQCDIGMIFIPPVKLIPPYTVDSKHTNNILYII